MKQFLLILGFIGVGCQTNPPSTPSKPTQAITPEAATSTPQLTPKPDTSKVAKPDTSKIAKPIQTKSLTQLTLAPEPICYLFAEPPDSTFLTIKTDGKKVTGALDWIPNEKDSATGSFVGTQEGNIIKAVWSYTIEGSDQKEGIELKIEGNKVSRKVGELKEVGNVMVLKNPSKAPFSEIYTKVPCKKD